MPNQANRGVIRISCNYIRLFSTLILGIAVVPLTISWLGDDAFGLISFLGANLGLAAIVRQIVHQSLVRELGVAYHGGQPTMDRLYPAICRISLIAAVITLFLFLLMAAALPLFNMPDAFRRAAFWFVITQGVQSAVMVVLAPQLNIYLVMERFIGYSVWFVAVRAAHIIAVLLLGYIFPISDPPTGLLWLGVLWSALSMLGYVIAAVWIIRIDRRFGIDLRRPQPGAVKEVMGTFSWNSGVQIAMNLHEQVPQFLLNLFLGTTANAAWGLGFRLVAYIRMVTTGMQFGSDAVSARLASGADQQAARNSLQRLLAQQTRLTALVSLPAGFGVLLYAFPILHIWVGRTLEDYDATMGMGVWMARVLSIALAARAISDTWVLVLYGAGFVRRYAPLIMLGGLIAPTLAVILMFTLPRDLRFIGPAIGFTVAFFGLHLFVIPVITARCLHISALGLLLSLIRPLIVTATAAGAGLAVLAAYGRIDDLSLLTTPTLQAGQAIAPMPILISIATFGLAYAPLSFLFILGPSERARILGLARRVLRLQRP
jgi:O-antigen/teichoic acid export membrane protein